MVYVIRPNQGSCNLLVARAKVTPLKTLTIPRIELCAALLLTRLLSRVIGEFDAKRRRVHAWTDSQIVLAWLRSDPARWNTFEANRVGEIQREAPPAIWSHIPSKENPADLATRGTNPMELSKSTLWWHGPAWALRFEFSWPTVSTAAQDTQLEARSRKEHQNGQMSCHAALVEPASDEFMQHFFSLISLERTIARCLRIVRAWRHGRPRTMNGTLNLMRPIYAASRSVSRSRSPTRSMLCTLVDQSRNQVL